MSKRAWMILIGALALISLIMLLILNLLSLRIQVNELNSRAEDLQNQNRLQNLALQNEIATISIGNHDHQVFVISPHPFTSPSEYFGDYQLGTSASLNENELSVKLMEDRQIVDRFNLKGIVRPGDTVVAWYNDPDSKPCPERDPINGNPLIYWNPKTGLAVSIMRVDGFSYGEAFCQP